VAKSGGPDRGTLARESAPSESAGGHTPVIAKPVTVYWRPGCSSCSRLLRGLRTNEVAFEEVNIWDDATGAATVRALAHGTETVPTVVVGTVSLVNPSVDQVLQLISGTSATARHSPERRRRLTIGTVLVTSLFVDLLGHHALSWALDGVGVNVYVVWRVVDYWTARRLPASSPDAILQNEP
jgi:mycoredoxin